MNAEQPRIVPHQEWLAERLALLEAERAHTRERDRLAEQRRRLPWVRVDKPYRFASPDGVRTLADLFAGRSQLLVKHFMFGPGWEEGCVGCSFESDHIEAAMTHLQHHDVAFAAVSRAPVAEIEPFRRRMGWRFGWVSSADSDFNYDFHVSFTPEEMARGRGIYNYREEHLPIEELSGLSVFYRDTEGAIFHTYSTFGRGGEEILGSYMILDMLPLGRNENGPNHNLTDWVRHHDRYAADGYVDETGRFRGDAECCRTHDDPAAV